MDQHGNVLDILVTTATDSPQPSSETAHHSYSYGQGVLDSLVTFWLG